MIYDFIDQGNVDSLETFMGKAYPPGPRNAAEYVITTADKLVQYLKRNHLWILTFGLACCAVEMMHAAAALVLHYIHYIHYIRCIRYICGCVIYCVAIDASVYVCRNLQFVFDFGPFGTRASFVWARVRGYMHGYLGFWVSVIDHLSSFRLFSSSWQAKVFLQLVHAVISFLFFFPVANVSAILFVLAARFVLCNRCVVWDA